MRYYDYPTKEKEDVHIELADLEKVKYGEVFKGRVHLEVSIDINLVRGTQLFLFITYQELVF